MFRPNAEWSEQSGATFPAGMARPMGPYDNTANSLDGRYVTGCGGG
jgi:hypothetical protein